MKLRECKPGMTVKVLSITRGTEILVRKLAPLGDPVEVTVRGFNLSLRKADADILEVESV